MSKGDRNEVRPANYVKISRALANDLYLQASRRCFQFLNREGEVMTIQEGLHGPVSPIQENDWVRARLLAEEHDASYIVNFNTKKVLFRVMTPSNTPSWWPAVVGIDDLSDLNYAEQVPYEPLPDGSQPKKKRLSGAQNRKRYGDHRPRKR